MPRLTNEQVDEVRRRNADGVPATRLARDYGVSYAAILYWLRPEKRRPTLSLSAEDYDRLCTEARRRSIPVSHLVHDLIERGLPKAPARLEAAE